ncbi:ABC transporter permease subunit [Roseomonas gilardii]|uniref:ABC transporter permease subunit n=1 Tax=Roseomonas gilardii TaxID=257708 RepID=UPI00119EEDD0|nr:ABC transporter permease subunit [Roseomonas gilardii]
MSDTQVIGATRRSSSSLSDRSLARAARALLPGRLNLGKARRFVSPLVIVLLWQAASMAGLISPRTLAAPSTVIASAWELTLSGELPHHLLVSLGRVALGLSIGVTAGVAFALIAGLSKLGEEIVDAPLQMLRTLPFLALVPLFILWFGIGETPKIALVALGTSFPVYLTLFAGIRGVDPKLMEAGKVFGLDQRGMIRHVILPGALPSGIVGLRYAIGTAWLSLVIAEQINATSGIGYLINDARDFLRTDVIVVGLVVYALLGLGADALMRLVERRTLAWRPSLIKA